MSHRNAYQPLYSDLEPNEQLVAAYVDRYQLYQHYKENHYKEDPKQEARLLKMLFNVLAPEKRLLAIVDQYDKAGIDAYGAEGYDLRTMNGDRPQELLQLVNREATHQQKNRPKHVVVVSDDPSFVQLCATAEQYQAEVAVWSPGFQRSGRSGQLAQFNSRPLSDLLPEIHLAEASAAIWLDIENLLISLKKKGVKVDIEEFVNAIRIATDGFGNITNTIAYGDFEVLAKEFGQNLQSQLSKMDVEPRYQHSVRQKNSADMKIASDIHTFLMSDSNIQTIIIGTGDRDFRPTVDVARRRGKKVILLAVRGSLSVEIERVVDEVRYLDDYFKSQDPEQGKLEHSEPNPVWKAIDPSSEWTELLMRFAFLLHRKGRWWIPRKQLSTVVTPQRLQEAIDAGLLKFSRSGDPSGLALNVEDPLAQAVQFFVPWIVGRVHRLIEIKVNTGKMKYIDTNFLFQEMMTDQKCKDFGVGQKRGNANAWLNAAAKAEILVRKPMPHFSEMHKRVDTWWPVDYTKERPSSEETKEQATKESSGEQKDKHTTETSDSQDPAQEQKKKTAENNPPGNTSKLDISWA